MAALPKIPMGESDFKAIREGDFLYVDKSLWIKALNDQRDKGLLITRPRRFGKSLNLSMLKYFFDAQEVASAPNLFQGLTISKHAECMKHQGQYTVIHLSFIGIKGPDFGRSYNHFLHMLKLAAQNLLAQASDAMIEQHALQALRRLKASEASSSEVEQALWELIYFAKEAFNRRVMLLIDEYDVPLLSAYKHGYYEEMVSLLQGFLVRGLKDNTHLDRAILTGVSRIARESIFSDLNHITVYSTLQDKFATDFGFTESEVSALLEQYGLQEKAEQIKDKMDRRLYQLRVPNKEVMSVYSSMVASWLGANIQRPRC